MEQPAYTEQPIPDSPIVMNESPVVVETKQDRRMSDEWDAAKVPPSRFQKRKGSIYATPSSRDGHVDKNYADKYHAKLAEKYGPRKRSIS
jgi:hypothetical protein